MEMMRESSEEPSRINASEVELETITISDLY